MSATRYPADHEPAFQRSEGAAERALLLWIALYSALVIVLVGNHVYGRGLPLIDNYGRLAQMAPDRGLTTADSRAGDPAIGLFTPGR